jgi:hypothetical protein
LKTKNACTRTRGKIQFNILGLFLLVIILFLNAFLFFGLVDELNIGCLLLRIINLDVLELRHNWNLKSETHKKLLDHTKSTGTKTHGPKPTPIPNPKLKINPIQSCTLSSANDCISPGKSTSLSWKM